MAETKNESVKTAAQHFSSIRPNVKRLSALGEGYGALNTFAETEYAKSLGKFADGVKQMVPQAEGALKALQTESERLYDSAVKDPNAPWTQDSWDKPFKAVEDQLTQISKSLSTSSETKEFISAKLRELETLKKDDFDKAAAALDRSIASQADSNSMLKAAIDLNDSLPIEFKYGVKSSSKRILFEPATLDPKDEEEIKKEQDKNALVLWSLKEDEELRKKMKKLQASKSKYYRCMSGPFKDRLIEYSENGCRPVPGKMYPGGGKGLWRWMKDKYTGSTELMQEGYGAAMDLMRFKDPNCVLTYSIPVVSDAVAKKDHTREMFFTKNEFGANYIRKNILPALEAAQKRGGPFELDQDVVDYLARVRAENRDEWFHDTRMKLAGAWDSVKNTIPLIRSLFKDHSLEAAFAELDHKLAEMQNAAQKEKIIGKNQEEMDTRVKQAKDKLEQQPASTLKAAYDKEYERIAAMDPGKPVIGSGPLKPEEELSANEKLAKQDADTIRALNKTSSLIDTKLKPEEQAELIKKELEKMAPQLQAAVEAETLMAGQIHALEKKVDQSKQAGYELISFLQEHIEKLDDLRTVQEAKLEEIVVKAKMLHQTAQDLTGLSEKEHDKLVEQTKARVDEALKTRLNSRANLDTAITKYKTERANEKQEAAAHVAAPGGPAGPAS